MIINQISVQNGNVRMAKIFQRKLVVVETIREECA